MIELLALVGAIVLVVLVQLLRAILAMPFPRLRARRVPARPPAGVVDLFEEADAALRSLGFVEPEWLLYERCDGEPVTMPLRVVYRHPDSGGFAWLAPPAAPLHAHRLFTYFSHRLADGRVAISQPFDSYFELTQTDEIVGRTSAEPALVAQWREHLAWAATQGATSSSANDAELLDQAVDLIERQRRTLIERGALRAVSDDLAVPRFRFAWHLLRGHYRQPKPPVDARPLSPARLGLLASVVELVSHRAPPRRAQLLLFTASVALFMALGALLWDPSMALIILIVVLVHELGHFLAMRAFGYRNVHLLALPLVGGVAMGVDANPDAARRAWMSLMGPLPGILIGWALLAMAVLGAAPDWAGDWIVPFATVFLLINYLNVLPIPPLDGAHVVEALLPARLGRAQTLLVAAACLAGAWLAWQLGFWILVALPLLQLLALPAQWKLHEVHALLAQDRELAHMHPAARTLRILQTLDRVLGPSANGSVRINQALQTSLRLRTRPMRLHVQLGTGLVYLALLVVPVGGLVANSAWLTDNGAFEARYIEMEQQTQSVAAQVDTLSDLELVAALADTDAVGPASADELAAAEARLGQPLPADLQVLYTISNGLPQFGVAGIDSVASSPAVLDDFAAMQMDALMVENGADWTEIQVDTLRGWWDLGEGQILYDPAPTPSVAGLRVIDSMVGYPSVRAWLEATLVARRIEAIATQSYELAIERARSELEQAGVPVLLAEFQPPSLVTRWLFEMEPWPAPAGPEAINAFELRIGRALPSDLMDVFVRHDGFPPLQLLPLDEVARWSELRERIPEYVRSALAEPGIELSSRHLDLDEDRVANCLVIAATRLNPADISSHPGGVLVPALLSCPSDAGLSPIVDVHERSGYAEFRLWLLDRTARMRASHGDA